MIVRVMEEGQYRLDDAHAAEFERLDGDLLSSVNRKDQLGFTISLSRLLQFVRTQGQRVPNIEIVPSDMIIPAEDMTLADAQQFLEPQK